MNTSSYDTYNVQASKGIKLGDKVFLDLAIEGKKGNAYREKEKNKKLNLIAGIDYKLNDKHNFRLEKTKFIAKDNSTDELTHKELSKNRRGAGKSDFEVDSDRDAFTARYEYTPNKNWKVSTAYNQSNFTRKIKQNNRPFITFLPSESFNDFFGIPDGYESDLVLRDVDNKLDGSITEKIKNFKFKTDYKYDRGNLVFGYDYGNHSLRRDMNIEVEPFVPLQKSRLLIRPAWQSVLDEENLADKDGEYLFNLERLPYIMMFTNAMFNEDMNPVILEDKFYNYFNHEMPKILHGIKKDFELKDTEKVKILERRIGKGKLENLKNLLTLVDDLLKYENNPIKLQEEYDKAKMEGGASMDLMYATFWKYLEDFSNEKIKDYVVPGTKSLFPINLTSYDLCPPIELTDDLTVGDVIKIWQKESYGDVNAVKQSAITNSWVDVKKTTDSFYLHNSFDLTNKLSIDTGLRYEKAKYRGERHTDSSQVISVQKNKNGEYGNGELALAKQKLDFFGTLSDTLIKGTTAHQWEDGEIAKIKYKELQESGKVIIPMVSMDIKNEETKTNIGGNLGFNYKFNDTDILYGTYERAFNSPLPTQLTNKTLEPRTKLKTYWESHIKSENMDNFELGIRGVLNNNITYSIAGFMSNTHNEILSVVKNGSSHMLREWRYINLEKTRRMGIELQSTQVFDKLKLKESFTYVNPKILSNDLERTTHQIYEDGKNITLKNYLNNRKYILKKYTLEEIKNLKENERNLILNDIDKLYRDTLDKKISLEKAKEEAEHLISGYKKEYKNIDFSELEKRVLTGAFPKPEGDLYYLSIAKDSISKQYRDELESAIKGKFLKKGDKIPLTPKVKATFSADYQFTEKFNLGTNFTYIGSYDSAEPVNGYGIKTVKVPHHLVADLYGTFRVNDSVEVKFGVNNLFDHKHYLRQDSKTATPASGRTYNLGVTYRF